MPGIENILLTFVCEAIYDELFQMKFCKLTRSVCPVTPSCPWCWPGPGSGPLGAGAEAAEAASSPPRSWCHWWCDNVVTIRWASSGSLAPAREKSAHSFWSLIFISADVIRVSRSPIKVSAAWQQITSVTNISSHVTASEVWLWHHYDITHYLPWELFLLSGSQPSITRLFWLHSTVHSHWLQFSQTLDCV